MISQAIKSFSSMLRLIEAMLSFDRASVLLLDLIQEVFYCSRQEAKVSLVAFEDEGFP